jgi:hypothetical protein
MRSPLYYFAAFLLCMFIGSLWLITVAAPALIGLPPTAANFVFAAFIGAPTLIAYIAGGVFSHRMLRA